MPINRDSLIEDYDNADRSPEEIVEGLQELVWLSDEQVKFLIHTGQQNPDTEFWRSLTKVYKSYKLNQTDAAFQESQRLLQALIDKHTK
ncbi:MAG: hypothetical protein P4L74_00010 [Candidatus Doudnabacteria bacterium]|nr:hypothetical protein [Candidatus Doudnabacteria bacterium]